MNVPSEIRKLLGGREPRAYASLSCSFHGPIGETHFVVADGQLFVFERESLIGDFKPVALDAEHTPKLERGTFSDVLHVALADGAAYELNVSSFERDAIVEVLAQTATPAPAREDVPADSLSPQDTDPAPTERNSSPDEPPPSAFTPDENTGLIDLKQAVADIPAPAEAPPAQQPPFEAADNTDNKEEEDKRLGQEVASYFGSDAGCFGCALLLTVFASGIVGFWYLHIEAARSLGILGASETESDSFTFIATKGLALVAGGYVGVRAAQLVGKILNILGLTGRVMFSQNVVQVFGRLSKWHILIGTTSPFELSLESFSATEPTTDGEGKPANRSISYYLRIQQYGKGAILKTTNMAPRPFTEIAGMRVRPAPSEPTSDQLITFEYKTFKKVVRRLNRLR